MTAVDYGGGKPIQVVYQLWSVGHKQALRVKCELPLDGLTIGPGTIIEATNLREGTRLAILQYPTGSRDRPRTDRLSGGRFLLLAPGYLETAVYRPGRAITVVGEVRGQQVLPLDDTTYRYPLFVPRELYLWREGYDIPRFHIGFGLGFSTGF